jgi:hypothetical protein
MPLPLPAGARRLFPAHDLVAVPAALATEPGDLAAVPAHVAAAPAGPGVVPSGPAAAGEPPAPELPFVIARLLEDGDSADLRWLIGAAGEPALAAWLERHGARQLSRRSLAFWQLALGRRARPAAAAPGPGIPPMAPIPELPRKALWPL